MARGRPRDLPRLRLEHRRGALWWERLGRRRCRQRCSGQRRSVSEWGKRRRCGRWRRDRRRCGGSGERGNLLGRRAGGRQRRGYRWQRGRSPAPVRRDLRDRGRRVPGWHVRVRVPRVRLPEQDRVPPIHSVSRGVRGLRVRRGRGLHEGRELHRQLHGERLLRQCRQMRWGQVRSRVWLQRLRLGRGVQRSELHAPVRELGLRRGRHLLREDLRHRLHRVERLQVRGGVHGE